MLTALQRSILFPREYARPLPNAGEGIAGLETLWLDTDEGDVEAWVLPGDGVSADEPGPAVIFAHGNAELIDYWPGEMQPYRDMGVTVMLGEYRGYGRSAGAPSQAAITDDFVAFYDMLAGRHDADDDRIVLHGRSLGGGVLAQLAAVRKPAAMILESTFTSVADFAAKFFVPKALVPDPFDTMSVLETLDVPTLIMHGTNDSVVPFDHARKLHDAAADSRLVTYECDHNDFPPDRRQYWRDVRAFWHNHDLT